MLLAASSSGSEMASAGIGGGGCAACFGDGPGKRRQTTAKMLLIAATLVSRQRRRCGDEQRHGDDVREPGPAGKRNDARHQVLRQAAGDAGRVGPDDGGSDQLQVGNEARRKMDRADLRAIAELEHGGDQVDDHRRIQLVDVVVRDVADVAEEEAEVQRGGKDDEKAEDDLFQIHAGSPWQCVLPPPL